MAPSRRAGEFRPWRRLLDRAKGFEASHETSRHRTSRAGRQRDDRRAPRGVEIIALGRPRLDLTVRDVVLAALRAARCDVIVNVAAYTEVDKAESEPEAAMRVNGEGAGYVAEIAAELRAPLLHLSTDYVFDGALDRPYREDDATGPTSAYGRSKLVGEQRIASIHPNHAILRTAWVTARSAPISSRRCCALAKREAKRALSPTSAATRLLRSTSSKPCSRSPSGARSVAGASRRVPSDRPWRSDLGGIRRGDLRRSRRARARAGVGQTDRDGGLSDGRPPPGEFPVGYIPNSPRPSA